MNNIVVFTEYRNKRLTKGSLEAIVKARELADISQSELIAVSDTLISESDRDCVYSYGADKIAVFKLRKRNPYDLHTLTDGFCALLDAYHPWMILFCSTDFENDMACRVGIKKGLPVMTNCLDVYLENDTVKIVCPDDTGEYMITYRADNLPAAVTLKQGITKIPEEPLLTEHKKRTDYIEVDKDSSLRLQKKKRQTEKVLDIQDAEVILSCGRGVGGEKGIELIEKLAELLHAQIGTSRSNVDEGLLDKKYQIGLSGKTVKPRCYIACGISGAMHHVIGMNQSEWVMAINVDRNEPIFDVSDVGVIGDLSAILPCLIKELEVRYGSKSE